MSTMSEPASKKRLRRSPDELRAAALAVSRRLIIERPGEPLTMRAVADAVGVTYPNIAHHFGSLAGLYAALSDELVAELFAALQLASDEVRTAKRETSELVTLVFGIFQRDGLATLLDWLLRSGDAAALASLSDAVALRVREVGNLAHGSERHDRFSRVFLLLAMAGFADAKAGALFGKMIGADEGARRTIIVDALAAVRGSY